MSLLMIALSDIKSIFATKWSSRKGNVVPEAKDVLLGNAAVTFEEAVVLYADLTESTELVDNYIDWFAAEIYEAYLHCTSKLIRYHGGEITAFDGDRVMAVFIGNSKCSSAAKCALKITHAVSNIINPAIKKQFPDCDYTVRHAVGIDTSKLFIARTGIRGSKDLVWVGKASNYAAKLCGLRHGSYTSFITPGVHSQLSDDAKFGGPYKSSMWEKWYWNERGMYIYRSNWYWML